MRFDRCARASMVVYDMDISDILSKAQKAIDDAKISEDLRQVAFQQTVQLLSQEAGIVGTGSAPIGAQRSASSEGNDEGGVDKIARKMGLPRECINEVYADNGQGGVDLVVGVGKLENSTAPATKQLALLVTGSRQLAELEQWTGSREIRKICGHYGRFDPANFAKTLRGMDDCFSFKGKGQQVEVRLHQRGIERLRMLLSTLTGATT
jgi:hypothetical protein